MHPAGGNYTMKVFEGENRLQSRVQRQVQELRARARQALSQNAGPVVPQALPPQPDSIHGRLCELTERILASSAAANAAPARQPEQSNGEEGGASRPAPKKVATKRARQPEGAARGQAASNAENAPMAPPTREDQSEEVRRPTLFRPPQQRAARPVTDLSDDPQPLVGALSAAAADEERIQAPLLGIAMTFNSGNTSFSPARGLEDEGCVGVHFIYEGNLFSASSETAVSILIEIITTIPLIEIITFNAAALFTTCLRKQRSLKTNSVNDVKTMAWMLTPSDSCGDFSVLVNKYLGIQSCKVDSNAECLPQLLSLYRKLYGLLGSNGMLQAYMQTEKRVKLILCKMKVNGFFVDSSALDRQRQHAVAEMEQLRTRAATFSSDPQNFNIQSPDQCRDVMFNDLQLQDSFPGDLPTTKTGKISTGEEVLKQLSEHHEFPRIILQYRKYAKLLQTYIDGFRPHMVDIPGSDVKLIHATYLQESTDTGRLSCADPNMQNLPRATDDEMMGSVRKAFIAPSGRKLLTFDYRQIELCVLAHFSQDPTLLRAIRSEDESSNDVHRVVAGVIFGVPASAVTGEQRTIAKRCVFGVIYGMGSKALAGQLNVDFERGAQIQGQFRTAFPKIEGCRKRILDQARRDGFVRTLTNRWRTLEEINDSDSSKRANAERQAFNTVIQGTAADIVKRAMVAINASDLPWNAMTLIAQIHDELVFTVDEATVPTVVARIQELMCNCVKLDVPLRTSVCIGDTFGDLAPL